MTKMYGYGLDIVTNDYQFLFRFALETDALIESNDFDSDSICNNFTLRYGDEMSLTRARCLLESIIQGR